jgi:FHA domain-containing protein
MSLTLVAVSLDEQPLSKPITATFDARGGTIGRADHNTMALPDPQRHISRLQAEILASDESYRIRNVGANPIAVGSRRLGHGELAALAEGDAIRIGGYQLRATFGTDDATTQPMPLIERVRPPATRLPASAEMASPGRSPAPTPAADLLTGVPGVSGSNPFADLLGPTSAAAPAPPPPYEPGQTFADLMPPIQGIESRSAAVTPPRPPAPRPLDDFDPFAPRAPQPSSAAPAPDTVGDNPFADLLPSPAGPSVDAAFGLAPSDKDDPLAAFMAGSQGVASGPALPADPLALFGLGPSAPREAPPPQQDRLPAIHAQFTPPWSARASAPSTPPAPPPPPATFAPAALSSADACWRAFCEGAGLSSDMAARPSEESMRKLGHVMVSAIAGTLQLMAVRGSTKHELGADVTLIQQHDNNPLKFTPDAVTALEQLLRPPLRGFLDGPAAMDAAMFDLIGHSIGTVAGLRAAVEGMLARFAPEALERKLVGNSVLDSLVPMARKARLWELYLQHHEAIREEAQEDFQALFGKAFIAAYGQQVERLKREARR